MEPLEANSAEKRERIKKAGVNVGMTMKNR
jgi:hypothetical protein